MTFAHPFYVVPALLALVALAWLYRRAGRRRNAQALTYSNLEFALGAMRPATWPARLVAGAFFVGTFGLLVALAGPHFTSLVPGTEGTVVICIDTSGSMRALDVEPSRAEAAKAAAQTFIDAVPDGTHIGIVAFSSTAQVVQAPTADLDIARGALDRLPPPEGGTAIGDALALAAGQMPPSGERMIVLLTDGVNNLGRNPIEAARAAAARGIAIETVGVGTSDSGQIIPGTDETADLDSATLRSIAQISGGHYAEARDAQSLNYAFRNIALSTVWERRRVDGSLAFAFSGGLIVAIAFLAALGTGRLP